MDFSECVDVSRSTFAIFMEHFDKYCNVRYLTLDNMLPDLSTCIEELGLAFSSNKKCEVLSMRNNKIKSGPYGAFWLSMCGNHYLKKINVSKTDINDKVLASLLEFLQEETTAVTELDISKNQITDVGLKTFALGLANNEILSKLNMEGNHVRSEGCRFLADFLCSNTALKWLSLGSNKINNEGIMLFTYFLE